MPKNTQITNKQLAEIVQNEELGYVILDYMDGANLKDPVIREHFIKAKEHMKAIMAVIEPLMEE